MQQETKVVESKEKALSNLEAIRNETKRLADADIGTQGWVGQIVKSFMDARDDDYGTIVVAHALLSQAIDDERRRKETEAARVEVERRRNEERRAAEARQIQEEQRRTAEQKIAYAKMISKGPLTTGLTILACNFLTMMAVVIVYGVYLSGGEFETTWIPLFISDLVVSLLVYVITKDSGLSLFIFFFWSWFSFFGQIFCFFEGEQVSAIIGIVWTVVLYVIPLVYLIQGIWKRYWK